MFMRELSIIEARDGVPGLPYAFTLGVQLANPNAPTDLDGDGIPDPVPPVDAGPPAVDAGQADAAPAAAADAPEGVPAGDEPAVEPAPAVEGAPAIEERPAAEEGAAS